MLGVLTIGLGPPALSIALPSRGLLENGLPGVRAPWRLESVSRCREQVRACVMTQDNEVALRKGPASDRQL